MIRYSDRSRAVTRQRCPRKRFLQYEYAGQGFVRGTLNIDIEIGIAVHEAAAQLLNGAREQRGALSPELISTVAQAAGNSLLTKVRETRLDLKPEEDQFSVAHEAAAMVQALVLVWGARRLPALLEEYEILGVEQEGVTNLSDNLVWMSRADAVLRGRQTGQLEIFSLKTKRQWDVRSQRDNRVDMQGVSEIPAVEAKYGEKVTGIRMEFLMKGYRSEYPKGSGIHRYNSPLTKGWRLPGVTPDQDRYAWAYQYVDEMGSTRKLKKGVRGGPSWTPFEPWAEGEMGLETWIARLLEGNVEPAEAGDPLANVVISPEPILRSGQDIDEWRASITAQEAQVAEDARRCLDSDTPEELSITLATLFPKYRHSCNYPSQCSYHSLCWEGLPIEHQVELVDGVEWKWRVPHHEPELVQLQGAGVGT